MVSCVWTSLKGGRRGWHRRIPADAAADDDSILLVRCDDARRQLRLQCCVPAGGQNRALFSRQLNHDELMSFCNDTVGLELEGSPEVVVTRLAACFADALRNSSLVASSGSGSGSSDVSAPSALLTMELSCEGLNASGDMSLDPVANLPAALFNDLLAQFEPPDDEETTGSPAVAKKRRFAN